ncbi:malonyl-ACP O-methyltransferase BioC [Motiliproteus sp.]|uniref:malonyl-ACP O-methyltransferase BioC n=1 Tax=Motiliproteus sp. TaxID=1898955 RepID=UPI003BAAA636
MAEAAQELQQKRQQEHHFDKRQVAGSFSRAAISYDSVAGLQRRIGTELLSQCPNDWQGQLIDLGSGTGFFSLPLAQRPGCRVLAVDLAQGMLEFARRERPHSDIDYLCADAEQLPLADASIDGLFSSLAIQWCLSPAQLFTELARVLKPGATAMIATLGPQTLYELRQAWAAVDDFEHVNRFESLQTMQQAIEPGFELVELKQQEIVLQYDQLKQMTDELKGIGAHNLNSGRQHSLSGRARIRAFRDAYEQLRDQDGKIPATYQVFYFTLRRR